MSYDIISARIIDKRTREITAELEATSSAWRQHLEDVEGSLASTPGQFNDEKQLVEEYLQLLGSSEECENRLTERQIELAELQQQ